jgi:hypothetical protein
LRVTPSSSPKYCNHRYCIPWKYQMIILATT